MTLSFTGTFEDHVAAQRLMRKPAPGEGPRLRERLLFLWILLGVIAAVLVSAIAESIVAAATGRPQTGAVTNWIANVLLQWALYLVVFGLLWFAMCAFVGPVERPALRRMFLLLAGVILLSNVATTLFFDPAPPTQHATAEPEGGEGGASAWITWLVLFAFIWIVTFRYLRGATRRNWDAQPHLRRPQTLELTPHGLRFADDLCVRDYQWAGFTKWREDDGLFVLFVSNVAYHIVPKRAMASPAEVEQFRRLLQQHVRPVDPQPAGFAPIPVLPLAAPPPLPAPPLPALPLPTAPHETPAS